MYKQTVITIVLLIALIISGLANVSYSRLQNSRAAASHVKAATAAESSNVSQPKNALLPKDSSEAYGSWVWLLPLLTLPFLFLALKKRASEDLGKDLWPYTHYSVGTKGGMSYGSAESHDTQ